MEDYKEEIKNLLQKFYTTEGEENKRFQRTTFEIWQEVKGIIPSFPIDEHDVFEILKELSFEQDQLISYEKVCIFEGNEKEGRAPEYDQQETGRIFVWNLYQKQ